LKTDQLHNYMSTRIKYGRYDLVREDLDSLKKEGSTEAGLSSLKEQGYANIEDTVDSYLSRLSKVETYANNVNELYKSFNLRFAGELDENNKRK